MANYAGVILDRNAVVSAVGSVRVAVSVDRFFTSDSVALRCTWRFGHIVVRPDRIGKFIITTRLVTAWHVGPQSFNASDSFRFSANLPPRSQ